MRYLTVCLLPVISALLGTALFAAPVNDNIRKATELTETRINRITSNIDGATPEYFQLTQGEQTYDYQTLENTVWFKWTSPISGTVSTTSSGRGFPPFGITLTDVVISETPILPAIPALDLPEVYLSGTVVAQDNLTTNYVNSYTYQVVAGQVYYTAILQVDFFEKLNGDFSLVQFFVQDALSDSFEGRTQLAGRSFTITGNNAAFTAETDEPAHGAATSIPLGQSAWMTWTTPTRSQVTLTTTNFVFDALIAVYSGDTLATLTKVAQSTSGIEGQTRKSTVSFIAEAGVAYHFAVDGSKSRAGGFNFSLVANTVKPGFLVKPANQTVYDSLSATFSAVAATTDEPTYQWQLLAKGTKVWVDLVDDDVYRGTTTPDLEITSAPLEFNGNRYRLAVTDSVGTGYSPPATLTVTEFRDTETEVLGTVSIDLATSSIPAPSEDEKEVPGFYYATGLPKGVTLDPVTGLISGKVIAKPGTYRVTYGSTTGKTKNPEQFILIINVGPFAPLMSGSFEALLTDPSLNAFPVGKLSIKVANNGTFSGKYFQLSDATSYSVKGTLDLDAEARIAGSPIDLPFTLSRGKNQPPYQLEFALVEPPAGSENAFASFEVALLDSESNVLGQTVSGIAVSRFTKTTPADWVGNYTTRLTGISQTSTDLDGSYPYGSGFATGKIAVTGALSLRGRLPDNTAFTANLPSSINGKYLAAQRVHSARGGSLAGPINLEAQLAADFVTTRYRSSLSSNSELLWVKPASPRDKLYPAGFGTAPLSFTVLMERWVPPAGNFRTSLGLSTTGEFRTNIVSESVNNNALTNEFNSNDLPIELVLAANGAVTVPNTNSSSFSVKFTASTGAYSGSFLVTEPLVEGQTKPTQRKVTFSGVLFQSADIFEGDVIGEGFFILPSLNPSTEPSTSGLLDFRAGPSDSPFLLDRL